jgi:hypothetical protein
MRDVTISRILIVLLIIGIIIMVIGYYRYGAGSSLTLLGVEIFLSAVFARFAMDIISEIERRKGGKN